MSYRIFQQNTPELQYSPVSKFSLITYGTCCLRKVLLQPRGDFTWSCFRIGSGSEYFRYGSVTSLLLPLVKILSLSHFFYFGLNVIVQDPDQTPDICELKFVDLKSDSKTLLLLQQGSVSTSIQYSGSVGFFSGPYLYTKKVHYR